MRAEMVHHLRDYPWSSHRTNAEGLNNPLITPHEQYLFLGRSAYRELFSAHLDPQRIDEIRRATNGNDALGNKRFSEEIEQAPKRRAAPGRSGRPTTRVVVDV